MTARAALVIWTLALACAAGSVVLIEMSDHTSGKLGLIVLAAPILLAFVASGIVARFQRPDNRTGTLLIIVGFSWFLGALSTVDNAYVFTAGLVLGTLFTALLAHLLLAFPTGRLPERADRVIAATFYAVVLLGPTLAYLFDEGKLTDAVCDGPCPDNVLSVAPAQTLATVIAVAYGLLATALAALVLARLVLRWRRASPALRRALSPVFATAAILIGLAVVQTIVGFVSEAAAKTVNWLVLGALLAVPLAFLYGLLRSRFGATTRRLVAELSEKRTPEEVQAVLRRALRDPTLELGYMGSTHPGYVGVDGRPLRIPGDDADRVVTQIGDAILVHDASLLDQPELDEVVHAAHIALERGLSLRLLEESERRAHAVLDAIPDNVYRLSKNGVFLDAHAKGRGGYPGELIYPGVAPSSLIGRRIDEVMPEISDVVLEGIRRALETNEIVSVEYQTTEPNGVRDHETRIVRSGEDEVLGIVRDVTGEKKNEEALRELADAQGALRRVATLAAEVGGRERGRLFRGVTEEAARLLGAQSANTVRFAEDGTATAVGGWAAPGVELIAAGTPVPMDSETPLVEVARTGRPARIESYEGLPGDLAARLRRVGWRSGVSAPIFVSGRLWGAITAGRTVEEPFPEGAERRIAEFGEIVGIALANAEAREQLAGLAEEQAALNRVAVAVATASSPEQVFDVVTEEVARLLGADAANLVRFEPTLAEGIIVGKWSEPGVPIPGAGTVVPLDGGALTTVARTGAPARMGTEDPDVPESLRQRLRPLGVTSVVAAPIVVSGEPWGAVVVSVTGLKEFAPDAEVRIGQFAGLVAVALANAQAREELATLADEQAALSRVAVAVATEAEPERLFNAVSEEVGRLLGARSAATVRYVDGEDASVIVGGWGIDDRFAVEVDTLLPFQGGAIERVFRTRKTARVDIENETPAVQQNMRSTDVSSQVAAPIVVSGRLWGATSVSVGPPDRFPHDAEERLGKFTRLVAVALANAQAREELATLAEEQAALSRVAVAVATEEHPERLFNAVSEEIGRLFRARSAATVRYVEDADAAELVGGWAREGKFDAKLGVRLPFQGGAIARVRKTGRTARIDLENEPRDVQEHMIDAGVTSGVAAPIVVSGRLWGSTSISINGPERFPADVEKRLEKFTNLVAVALANAEAREELNASRARIVQAGDAERRRLERNLHDGAQQRLVSVALGLRLAQTRLPDDATAAAELLGRASEELTVGLEDLRELARGLHPAILSDRGLGAALEALATRAPVPVELDGVPTERLPPPVEAAAYYVVAESLTNVARYAEASSAHVSVMQHNGLAIVEVEDDGVGGADVSRGSGLRGLADRVEALDGRLVVTSETGRGTRVRAEIPCSRRS